MHKVFIVYFLRRKISNVFGGAILCDASEKMKIILLSVLPDKSQSSLLRLFCFSSLIFSVEMFVICIRLAGLLACQYIKFQ